MRSNLTDGQPFWDHALSPSMSSVVVPGIFGSVRPPSPSVNRPLGSSGPADRKPPGRWYLKVRPSRARPLDPRCRARGGPRWHPHRSEPRCSRAHRTADREFSLLVRPVAHAIVIELAATLETVEAVAAAQRMLIVVRDGVGETHARGR